MVRANGFGFSCEQGYISGLYECVRWWCHHDLIPEDEFDPESEGDLPGGGEAEPGGGDRDRDRSRSCGTVSSSGVVCSVTDLVSSIDTCAGGGGGGP